MHQEKGLVGLIVLFILVTIVGAVIAYFIYLKGMLPISFVGEKRPTPAQIKELHERNFVNPR